MNKKTIIKITIWVVCIVVFICWMIVTGGELKNLKAIDENYEISVTVMETDWDGKVIFGIGNNVVIYEKHIEGDAYDAVKKTVYEFTGEDAVHFRDILINGIKARRLFGGELNVRDPISNKRITIVANHKTENGDFNMDIIYRDYLSIPEATNGFLRNYHEELESEVLEFLSNYDPISDD